MHLTKHFDLSNWLHLLRERERERERERCLKINLDIKRKKALKLHMRFDLEVQQPHSAYVLHLLMWVAYACVRCNFLSGKIHAALEHTKC